MGIAIATPFPEWALPQLWGWIESFRARVCDDYAPKTLDEFLASWEARRERERTWAVYRDEELGGMVSVEMVNPEVASTYSLFARRFWRHETTAAALRMVYGDVLGSGVRKITWPIFADNHQMRRLALAVGFLEETAPNRPLRGATRRNGELVDSRILSLFKEG